MLRTVLVSALVVLTADLCVGRDRNWRAGTIVDSESAEAYIGDIQPGLRSRNYDFSPGNAERPSSRSLIFVPEYAVRETYVIESAGERYVASRVYRSDKPSNLADSKDVKFAVVKKNVFILDGKGREHKFRLLKSPGR